MSNHRHRPKLIQNSCQDWKSFSDAGDGPGFQEVAGRRVRGIEAASAACRSSDATPFLCTWILLFASSSMMRRMCRRPGRGNRLWRRAAGRVGPFRLRLSQVGFTARPGRQPDTVGLCVPRFTSCMGLSAPAVPFVAQPTCDSRRRSDERDRRSMPASEPKGALAQRNVPGEDREWNRAVPDGKKPSGAARWAYRALLRGNGQLSRARSGGMSRSVGACGAWRASPRTLRSW